MPRKFSGKALARERKDRTLSETEFARLAGVTLSDLRAIERDERDVTGEQALALAETLNTSFDSLYGPPDPDTYRTHRGVAREIEDPAERRPRRPESRQRVVQDLTTAQQELTMLQQWYEATPPERYYEHPERLRRLTQLREVLGASGV